LGDYPLKKQPPSHATGKSEKKVKKRESRLAKGTRLGWRLRNIFQIEDTGEDNKGRVSQNFKRRKGWVTPVLECAEKKIGGKKTVFSGKRRKPGTMKRIAM